MADFPVNQVRAAAAAAAVGKECTTRYTRVRACAARARARAVAAHNLKERLQPERLLGLCEGRGGFGVVRARLDEGVECLQPRYDRVIDLFTIIS